MNADQFHYTEEQRVAALEEYEVMDTPAERDFDQITQLAQRIFEVPVAYISLLGEQRQWYKSKQGLSYNEIPKEQSICQFTIEQDGGDLIIENAPQHPRFNDHPLVREYPYIVFYAGVSLINKEGFPLGTLCLVDYSPREWNEWEGEILHRLADQVVQLLELKKKQALLQQKYYQLEEQNKTLTDSLQYAKRIQRAILPSPQRINRFVKDSFVLFKPLHIVSGDFYWFKALDRVDVSSSDQKFIVSVADCTGHGVPAGFISVIGNNILNKVVWEEREERPARILEQLDMYIEHVLHKQESQQQIPDGMDISLCCIDVNERWLQFAGALHTMYMFREGQLYELKGNIKPIGGFLPGYKMFDQQVVKLQRGDIFYLFSDGYPDQFGGPKGKKFTKKRFKRLLHHIHQKDMPQQKQILKNTIDNWMEESEDRQIDDICVVGFRV